jgi:hypothetical protein
LALAQANRKAGGAAVISADTLAILMAKGLAGEDLLEVVRAIDADGEAQQAVRTKRQERNHRYYESHKDERLNKRLNKTSDSDAKVSPSPPYDINSTPHIPFKNTHIRLREVFEKFWAVYPKRTNRKAALAKLETVLKAGVDPEKILTGAARYAEHVKFTERQFIKAPDAWLNAGKWDDELPAEPQQPPARAGPQRSSGDGMTVVLQKLREQVNGQSSNGIKDISPTGVSEPGTSDPSSRVSQPTGKPSGGGEILDFRPASPDARRSPASHSEAARTFEWPDPTWEYR